MSPELQYILDRRAALGLPPLELLPSEVPVAMCAKTRETTFDKPSTSPWRTYEAVGYSVTFADGSSRRMTVEEGQAQATAFWKRIDGDLIYGIKAIVGDPEK